MSQSPAIDQSALDKLKMLEVPGEPSLLVELIDLLLNNGPQNIISLHDLLKRGEIKAMRKESHSLKSSSRSLGAKRLGELCQKLESDATPETEFPGLVEAIEKEFLLATAELREIKLKAA